MVISEDGPPNEGELVNLIRACRDFPLNEDAGEDTLTVIEYFIEGCNEDELKAFCSHMATMQYP